MPLTLVTANPSGLPSLPGTSAWGSEQDLEEARLADVSRLEVREENYRELTRLMRRQRASRRRPMWQQALSVDMLGAGGGSEGALAGQSSPDATALSMDVDEGMRELRLKQQRMLDQQQGKRVKWPRWVDDLEQEEEQASLTMDVDGGSSGGGAGSGGSVNAEPAEEEVAGLQDLEKCRSCVFSFPSIPLSFCARACFFVSLSPLSLSFSLCSSLCSSLFLSLLFFLSLM